MIGQDKDPDSKTPGTPLCIHDLLAAQAERRPNAIAMLAPDRIPLTYGKLYDQVYRIAGQLRARGIKREDRVAVVLPNGPEAATAFLAVTSCATCLPLNPAYREMEFDSYLSDLGADALLVQVGTDSPARAVAAKRGLQIIELIPTSDAEAGVFTLSGDERFPVVQVDFAEPDDVAIVLHTSGTTSKPKKVPLTHTNICNTAWNISTAVGLTHEDRCINIMPMFHVGGLFGTTLTTLTAGASMVQTPGFLAPKFFEWMKEFQPTWYHGVPTMHQALLECAEQNRSIIDGCPLRFIRSTSAPLSPSVMAEMESVFDAPVIEAYGMTEAACVITNNPMPPGERKPGSPGPSAGPDLAVMDERGNLLPSGERGEVVVRGPSVMKGYENNPEANEACFIDGWFKTGDLGYLDEDGYLFLTGRSKEIINRGGEKISPREVEEVLLQHPDIKQAVTFALPDWRLGEDVAVAVVPREGSSITKRKIRGFAAERLAYFKVPRQVVILDEMPKGPTGKLQRIGLAQKLGLAGSDGNINYDALPVPTGDRPDTGQEFIKPRDALEFRIAKLWESLLGVKPIGVRDNFFEMGGDSMLAARLFAEIQIMTGKALPLGTLFEGPTVEQLSDFFRQEGWRPRWQSLVPIQSKGDKRPIFCVHPGSGNILGFFDLARHLGPNRPCYGLQSIGLDGMEPPLEKVEDMAERYLQEVRSVSPEGPYLLGGRCSIGGLVAYEMARQLLDQGEGIDLLMMLDTRTAPTLRLHKKEPKHYESLLRYPRRNLRRLYKKISVVFGEAQERRFEDVKAANIKARNRYVPKPIPVKILYILSEGQWTQRPDRFLPDAPESWKNLAQDGLELQITPGDHYTMMQEPFVQTMAKTIESTLKK